MKNDPPIDGFLLMTHCCWSKRVDWHATQTSYEGKNPVQNRIKTALQGGISHLQFLIDINEKIGYHSYYFLDNAFQYVSVTVWIIMNFCIEFSETITIEIQKAVQAIQPCF